MNEEIKASGVASEKATTEMSQAEITTERPNPKKSGMQRLKSGKIESDSWGAHLEFLTAKRYMAGETLRSMPIDFWLHAKEMAHVNFTKAQIRFFVVACPYKRVWLESEEYFANTHSVVETPPMEKPSYSERGPRFISHPNGVAQGQVTSHETLLYRSLKGYQIYGEPLRTAGFYNPTKVALRYRIDTAVMNDIFRDKRYFPKRKEYRDAVVTDEEFADMFHYGVTTAVAGFPIGGSQGRGDIQLDKQGMLGIEGQSQRGLAPLVYQNDYRPLPNSDETSLNSSFLSAHIITQQHVDEYRRRTTDVNKQDDEVIAELCGTRQARDDQPYIIGTHCEEIDFTVVPAMTDSEATALTLGADGANSYTHIKTEISCNHHSPRHGEIMVYYQISFPDNGISETANMFELTSVSRDDEYTPATANIKDQAFMSDEILGDSNFFPDIIGWRRRHSQLFRSENTMRGQAVMAVTHTATNVNPRSNQLGARSLDPRQTNAFPRTQSSTEWHGMRSVLDFAVLQRSEGATELAELALLFSKLDISDIKFIRMRLDTFREGERLLEYKMRSLPTFRLSGTYTWNTNMPVDPKIKDNFIPNGQE